jgi:hypothetical protein
MHNKRGVFHGKGNNERVRVVAQSAGVCEKRGCFSVADAGR